MGTNGCDLDVTLKSEYSVGLPTKETLVSSCTTDYANVPYCSPTPVSFQIEIHGDDIQAVTLTRTMGSITCSYNDFAQNV